MTPASNRAQTAPPRLHFLADHSSAYVSFAAVVRLPQLGLRDLDRVRVMADALPRGTQDYPHGTLLEVTQGGTVRCTIMPDCLLIRFSVPKGAAPSGVSLLASLLQQGSYRQKDLDHAVESFLTKPPDYWSEAFGRGPWRLRKVTRAEILSFAPVVFSPDAVTVEVGGDIQNIEPQLEQIWSRDTAQWRAVRKQPFFPDTTDVKAPTNSSGMATLTIDGTTAPGGDVELPTRLLSLYALGCGKTSSLFSISREAHAWSYRQEAYLWPARKGWQPRLFVVMKPDPENSERAASLLGALKADVSTWTPTTRACALGMAEATLLRGVPFGPILLGNQPARTTLSDRTAMNAYWRMKTGSVWSPEDLLEKMRHVSLDELKAEATSFLNHATEHFMPESPAAVQK